MNHETTLLLQRFHAKKVKLVFVGRVVVPREFDFVLYTQGSDNQSAIRMIICIIKKLAKQEVYLNSC